MRAVLVLSQGVGASMGQGRRWRKIKRDRINIRSLSTDPKGAGNSHRPSTEEGGRRSRPDEDERHGPQAFHQTRCSLPRRDLL